MVKVLIAALLYGVLFGTVELFSKRFRVHKESTRKVVHVVAGVSAAFLPYVMTFHQIIFLSLLFIPIMLASKRANFFSSIHQVRRTTYGEVYFPLSILITALLFPSKPLYIFGLLVMALADGFASIIGQKYGKQTYKIWASQKSYIGSLAFFIISAVLGLIIQMNISTNDAHAILYGLLMAVVLTIAEAIMSYGLDNLILPILAALLLKLVL